MLSVTVHKDIAEYQPKVVGKMTGRTLISIVGALGVSVLTGVYLYFVLGLNPGDYMMVIYAVSLPFWCWRWCSDWWLLRRCLACWGCPFKKAA